MKEISFVRDGERAQLLRVGRIIDGIVLVLDLLHVIEKLCVANHIFYGKGSDITKGLVCKRTFRILQDICSSGSKRKPSNGNENEA